jgi:hypothetical protein
MKYYIIYILVVTYFFIYRIYNKSMKKIFLLCFIVAIILPNISTQALPTYWDMW